MQPHTLHKSFTLCAQRVVLWQRRNNTVEPFNETVQQVGSLLAVRMHVLDAAWQLGSCSCTCLVQCCKVQCCKVMVSGS